MVQILPYSESCKLYDNETNNSCAEASHVPCNSLLRVQMARNTRAVNVNIQRRDAHMEHQISNSNKSCARRACLDCAREIPANGLCNSLKNNSYVNANKSQPQNFYSFGVSISGHFKIEGSNLKYIKFDIKGRSIKTI